MLGESERLRRIDRGPHAEDVGEVAVSMLRVLDRLIVGSFRRSRGGTEVGVSARTTAAASGFLGSRLSSAEPVDPPRGRLDDELAERARVRPKEPHRSGDDSRT